MKKSKLTTFTVLVLIITMAALIMVSGTYAKYTSSATASDTATVAKWSILVNDDDITDGVTFSLFDTINEADTTTTESDVSSGVIAPGTGGTFALEIENASEVTASYTITLSETNASSVPIEYSTDGSTWVTAASFSKSNTAFAIDASETVTVYWRWAFEGTSSTNYTSSQTDTSDTALGVAAAEGTSVPEIAVTATITATQVD